MPKKKVASKNKNKSQTEKVCYRNSCEEKENIKKCKYCGQTFCKKHIEPFRPYVGLNQSRDRHEGDGGHPCPPYVIFLEEEEKRKEEEYRKALNTLLDKGKYSKPINTKQIKIPNKVYRGETLYLDDEDKENHTKITKSEKKDKPIKKEKNNKSIIAIGIIGVILIVLMILFSPIIIGNQSGNQNKDSPASVLDEQTAKAFSYINDFREKNNLPDLIYAEQLYQYIKDATQAKDISPDLFETSVEFKELIEYYVDTSLITKSYYTTYFIGGGGLEQFYKEFDKNYGARNIIKSSDYNQGAVYCDLDYCILFVFSSPLNTDVSKRYSTTNKTIYITSEKYKTNPKVINLQNIGKFTVYKGVNDYLSKQERSISYYYIPPTTKDFVLKNIDNEIQKPYLNELVNEIKAKYSLPQKQAEIAVEIVQKIPYDQEAADVNHIDGRYAYEVLYDMKGVCMEKSDLLAYLLRELGFGVAIFEFEFEEHRAVGIKCNDGNYNSQYCFIESTDDYAIGKIPDNYVGNVDIKNAIPEIVVISDGLTFNK